MGESLSPCATWKGFMPSLFKPFCGESSKFSKMMSFAECISCSALEDPSPQAFNYDYLLGLNLILVPKVAWLRWPGSLATKPAEPFGEKAPRLRVASATACVWIVFKSGRPICLLTMWVGPLSVPVVPTEDCSEYLEATFDISCLAP